MAVATKTVLTAVLLTASKAAIVDHRRGLHTPLHVFRNYYIEGDHLLDNERVGSKPGSPRLPYWREDLSQFEQWSLELGKRLFKLADAHDAMHNCGSFLSFGDFTWCNKAMPAELNAEYKTQYGSVAEYKVNKSINTKKNPPNANSLVALSFGIEEGDCWSELMSGLYFIKTELFDCYYSGNKGPMAGNLHVGHSRNQPCTTRLCYTENYHANKICLEDTSNIRTIHTDSQNRRYQSLLESLKGRKPLSIFLKMDVEGSEWSSLERLLENDEAMGKIRTLDLELHFNREPYVLDKNQTDNITFNHPMPSRSSLTKKVSIVEKLAKKFAVTGSTLEYYLNTLVSTYTRRRSNNEDYLPKPVYILTENGLAIDQFCLSFVNRRLL